MACAALIVFILQETTTVTQSIRVPSTSDVWVSTVVPYTVVVTHLATDYTYAPAHPDTVTSVVVVTKTPVSFQRFTNKSVVHTLNTKL